MDDSTSSGYPLILHQGADPSKLGGIAICGFSTIGSVGVIATSHLIKSFNLQHGAFMGYRVFDPEDYINQKMSDLNLLWHDKKLNIGSQYFSDSKYEPKKFVIDWVKKNKKKIKIYNNPEKAVRNADIIFSDKVFPTVDLPDPIIPIK